MQKDQSRIALFAIAGLVLTTGVVQRALRGRREQGFALVLGTAPTARSLTGAYLLQDEETGARFQASSMVPGVRHGDVVPIGARLRYSRRGWSEGLPVDPEIEALEGF